MNKFQTPAFLVQCYNDNGFCRSMHFDTEASARAWVEQNSGNYKKLVVERNVGGAWSLARKIFAIIAWPRTGSTHLARLLNGHDDILCNGEIFEGNMAGLAVRWPKADKKADTIEELLNLRRQNPSAFLERIWSQNYNRECVGFKIFPAQNDEVLGQLVADSSIRKVILLRRNILAVYSSTIIARVTGERKRDTTQTGRGWQPTVPFEPEEFIRFSNDYQNFYRGIFWKLQETRQPFHLQLYEHCNDSEQVDRLIRFIGAKPAGPLSSRMQKQNSADILSRFSNPDVASLFLQTHDLDWGTETMNVDEI